MDKGTHPSPSREGIKGIKQLSVMRLYVQNSDSYLYTMEEAALINRLNRNTFRDDFLALGHEVIRRKGKEFIRHDELKKYHAHYARVLKAV